MSIYRVAEVAGVSAATVSRVINDQPGVSAPTAELVRKTIEALDFTPAPRRRAGASPRSDAVAGKRIGFYGLELDKNIIPAYDHLLRGVSDACTKYNVDFHVAFIQDMDAALKQITQRRPDGLLLHGYCPPPNRSQALEKIPTVWLMGNPIPPHWGDQVMPDNLEIGRIAAQYLVSRGHRQVMYFGMRGGWTNSLRAAAFADAVERLDATATVVHPKSPLKFGPEVLTGCLAQLVATYREALERPTGLFVAEDWLLHDVYDALERAGIRPGHDLDIISCNNDRPLLKGLNPKPATIDIQFAKIAYRGVERLLARMQDDDVPGRLRTMVEPTLVLPDPPADTSAK